MISFSGSGTRVLSRSFSGAKTSGSYGYNFLAAGTYSYKSTVKNDTFTGTIAVAQWTQMWAHDVELPALH